MFTSRSEYRVSLRADNADLRLTEKGRQVGVVGDARWTAFQATRRGIEEGIEKLEDFRMAPEWWVSRGFEVRRDGNRRRYPRYSSRRCPFVESSDNISRNSAFDLLHYKGVSISSLLPHVPNLSEIDPRLLERIGIAGKYKQHILRQAHDIALFERDENLSIDSSVNYDTLPGMSHEVRQRLKAARPTTLVSSKL
jgi:tRNA uridine 5-carboxymethylaminomethyl modification enzyme